MRYAGVSDKISAVGLFEYNQNLDVNNKTAYLLAQMLWYFIDGYKGRRNELNPNIKNCTKYTVAFEDGKNEITFYKSQNSGDSWSIVNNWWEYYGNESFMLHADIPEVRFFLDNDFNEVALISTDGGIYISYDEIETVENLSMEGLGVSQYYSTYTKRTDPFHVYAGSQDQGFQRSLYPADGVLNFEQSISGDYGHLVSTDGGETIWCNYPGFTMFYANPETDGGGSSLSFPSSGQLWLPPLMIDPYDNKTVYIGGGGIQSQNHMVKVHYGLNGMEAEDMEYTFESKISAMAFSPINNNYWYVSTENGDFFYSDNSGHSFTSTSSFTGPESHYFYGSSILPSPVDSQRIYIAGSGYSNPGVYLSVDGGQTFSPFDNNLPNTLIYDLACLPDESMIFAASITPASIASALAALDIMETDDSYRLKLWDNTHYTLKVMKDLGFDTGASETPIIPIFAFSVKCFAIFPLLVKTAAPFPNSCSLTKFSASS